MLEAQHALLIPLAVSAVAPPTPSAEVPSVTIADLIRFSDAVVVGRVERVQIIHRPQDEVESGSEFLKELGGEVRFAEISISRILKGRADRKRVIFLAARTWTCDVTTAVAGETALLFLGDEDDGADFDENMRRRVRAEFPKGQWMHLAWSGYGRMPLRTTSGVVRVEWPMFVVEWPDDAPMGKFPRTDGSEFDRSVPLTWMEEKVRACLEEQRAPWFKASVTDTRDGSLPWDLEVSLDGNARLVIHEPAGDRETRFSAAPSRLPVITLYLRNSYRQPAPKRIGSGSPVGGVRRLQVVSPEPVVDLGILSIDEPCMAPDRRHFTGTLLEAWSRIRGLFDEPACSDHRVTDAQWR
jgi:hypothetical protein